MFTFVAYAICYGNIIMKARHKNEQIYVVYIYSIYTVSIVRPPKGNSLLHRILCVISFKFFFYISRIQLFFCFYFCAKQKPRRMMYSCHFNCKMTRLVYLPCSCFSLNTNSIYVNYILFLAHVLNVVFFLQLIC